MSLLASPQLTWHEKPWTHYLSEYGTSWHYQLRLDKSDSRPYRCVPICRIKFKIITKAIIRVLLSRLKVPVADTVLKCLLWLQFISSFRDQLTEYMFAFFEVPILMHFSFSMCTKAYFKIIELQAIPSRKSTYDRSFISMFFSKAAAMPACGNDKGWVYDILLIFKGIMDEPFSNKNIFPGQIYLFVLFAKPSFHNSKFYQYILVPRRLRGS